LKGRASLFHKTFQTTALFAALLFFAPGLVFAGTPSAHELAHFFNNSKTLKDLARKSNDPEQVSYFLRLFKDENLKDIPSPQATVDDKKNVLVLTGNWGKVSVDLNASNKNKISLNGHLHRLKSHYELEDFEIQSTASLWLMFVLPTYAHDSEDAKGAGSDKSSYMELVKALAAIAYQEQSKIPVKTQ
jgi:hypothetical protein